jgi:Cu2+-exporting ATPase
MDPTEPEQFCCAGCRAVYQTLHTCGLEAYYRLRETAGKPVRQSGSKFVSFDTPAFSNLYVRDAGNRIATVDLVLEGVTCAACVWLVERLPRVIPGVIECRLSLRQATVRVSWNSGQVKLSQIAEALDRLGYTPHPAKGISRNDLHRRQGRKLMVNLAIAGAIMGNCMLVAFALYSGRFGRMEPIYQQFFRRLSAILGMTSLALPGAVFFRSAISALRVRRINLDVPIAMALLVGGTAGAVNVILNRGEIYFDSLSVLVFLLLVGRFLQFRQQRYADDAVELLFSLAPATCTVVRDNGAIEEIPIEALGVGDLIEVKSGDVVAADGVVEAGASNILQALLTGESAPVAVGVGAQVFAGSQNQGAALRVRVTSIGENSRMGKLMRIVERGVAEKPAIVQFADRVGAWFVAIISLAAAGTFFFWARTSVSLAIDHSVALLIVTCPCVLGLATPLTLAMTIGQLARRDILVKSGAAIERLSAGGHLLLDKTGTLTNGRLEVVEWQGPEELKPAIAKLERQSQHPVARALVEAFATAESSSFPLSRYTGGGLGWGWIHQSAGISPKQLESETKEYVLSAIEDYGDGGLRANLLDRQTGSQQLIHIGSPVYIARSSVSEDSEFRRQCHKLEHAGLTVVLVALNHVVVGFAALGDRVREDSATAIDSLRKARWSPEILSGDAKPVVASVAKAAGVRSTSAFGQMTPEKKLRFVRERRKTAPVVMIGDGVNDAAALASADVGIAVHGGAEASLAAADIYIATPGITPVADLVNCARKTMGVIRRNLMISLAYNLLAGSLAAAGKMNPLICAILMPLSSATVLTIAIASVRHIGRANTSKGGRL